MLAVLLDVSVIILSVIDGYLFFAATAFILTPAISLELSIIFAFMYFCEARKPAHFDMSFSSSDSPPPARLEELSASRVIARICLFIELCVFLQLMAYRR